MTFDDEDPELTRAAEAVSDGVPLDPRAGPAEGEEPQVLENLRAIETIARVHREAAAAAPGSAPPPDAAEAGGKP